MKISTPSTPIIPIITTTIIAIILGLVDLGDYFNIAQPFWILIFYSYILVNYNIKYELFIALILGIFIDIASSNILGQSSLALVIASFFIITNKKSIKTAHNITIIIFILITSIIYLTSILLVHIAIQGFDLSYYIFISPVTTAIFYPLIAYIFKNFSGSY